MAGGLLLSRHIRDYSNGFRFYTRAAARLAAGHTYHYGSPIYLSEILALWMRHGLRIAEFPGIYAGRNEGVSKLRMADLIKASLAILEISAQYHVLGITRRDSGGGGAGGQGRRGCRHGTSASPWTVRKPGDRTMCWASRAGTAEAGDPAARVGAVAGMGQAGVHGRCENPGTDGTVHAATGSTEFSRDTLRALGQFRQSPGFREGA